MFRYLLFASVAFSRLVGQESFSELKSLPTSLSPVLPDAPLPKPYKSAALAGGLSIVPGLGHLYLGDRTTGSILFLTTTGSLATGAGLRRFSSYNPAGSIASASWMYGFYAAYRDARAYNGPSYYSFPMPKDDFAELAYAPFNFSVLKKPEVWGGLLGAFAGALAIGYVSSLWKEEIPEMATPVFRLARPLTAFSVGIGEEALFRGFFQSILSEALTPVGGIAFSSLLFGAAHIPNAFYSSSVESQRLYYTFGIPFITSFGLYFGWMTYRNQSLQESVALHSWYDFILFSATALTEASVFGETNFRYSFSF